jgi:hypothetical protein
MRSYYSHPVDVLRKFDPTLTESDLSSDSLFGADDLEKVWARIDEVESDFEDETGNPQRAVRQGVPGHPATWEKQDASLRRVQNGVKVWLDNAYVIPFDSNAGDKLEIRTGKDQWRDITDQQGTRWEMNPEDGWVRIFSRIARSLWSQSMRDQILRTTYRYNALGGNPERPGETTLDADVTDTDTDWTVADPQRLPPRGIVYVGAAEYVEIEDIDYDTGDVTVSRGKRATTAEAHTSGTTVHYCPMRIRGTIAGQVAAELVMYDDIVDELATPSDDISRNDRITNWQDDYEGLLHSFAQVGSP